MNNGSHPSEDLSATGVREPEVEIRPATHADVPALVGGVVGLLEEIGGKPAPVEQLEEAARALIDDPRAGVVLVADCDGEIVGVLSVSWQSAIRIPGRYGVIQEMWVKRAFRYREIGADMVSALVELARAQGIGRLEVGLPSDAYRGRVATESFYEMNRFTGIGLRMKRLL
ncbi:MAG: GNAT family N-acetyltransferase [Solirubrobacteraceae bacterium]